MTDLEWVLALLRGSDFEGGWLAYLSRSKARR